MANVIHFDERYKKEIMDGFNNASETDGLFDHSLDMEFSGVKTVHVKSLKTEPLQDYNRSVQVGTASRYGATKEVGNEEQTFTMTQDKSLSLSIDKGNNVEQFNMKKAGVVMTEAGATYPYGNDPQDSNIRIAPSLPPVAELEQAMDVFCTCIKLAALEKLLG